MKKKGKILLEVTDKDIELLKSKPEKFWRGVKYIGAGAFEKCAVVFDITIPSKVTLIEKAFENSPVRNVTFENGATIIPSEAFSGCSQLEQVNLPESVTELQASCFAHCKKLTEINLPQNLTDISHRCFYNSGLISIKIPVLVNHIGASAFLSCSSLKQVKFASSDEVKKYATEHLLKLDINGIVIEKYTFQDCKQLETVENSERICIINDFAFKNCENLQKFNANNAEYIYDSAFENCKSLTDVEMDSTLWIGAKAFCNTNIRELVCKSKPSEQGNCSKIKNIGMAAFKNCKNLKTVKLDKAVRLQMDSTVFENCKALEKAVLPGDLVNIFPYTFADCENLKEVVLEGDVTLRKIGAGSFFNCKKLSDIKNLPENLSKIEFTAFTNCFSLKMLPVNEKAEEFEGGIFKYLCKVNNKFYTSNEIISNDYIQVDYNAPFVRLLIDNWENEKLKNIFNNIKIEHLDNIITANNLLKLIYSSQPYSEMDFIMNWENPYVQNFVKNVWNINLSALKLCAHTQNANTFVETMQLINIERYSKFLNNLKKHGFNFTNRINNEAISRLYFNLGGMRDLYYENKNSNGKITQISYDQKISEFLTMLLLEKKITLKNIYEIVQDMQVEGFKKDFTDFLLAKKDKKTYNFEEMLMAETEFPGFISRCYNEFDNIQASNTSNKGSQRQLKPTFHHFYTSYIRQIKGITEHNEHIAKVVLKYYSADEVKDAFENARIINCNRLGYEINIKKFKELNQNQQFEMLKAIESDNKKEINKFKKYFKEKNKIANNILSDDLNAKIYLNKFSNLDITLKKCENISIETLKECNDIAKNFTFEWLNKADPENFVLGKMCNCCAHLEGAGFGIMNASIILPNVQNMVVRNNKGNIVAKATLFVNKEQGYAVFNTVEVSDSITDKQHEDYIYQQFQTGAKAFMQQYNKENDKPLKIITVGDNNNDLIHHFEKYNKASKIYKAINYAEYSLRNIGVYGGDSSKGQHIVCENEKETER